MPAAAFFIATLITVFARSFYAGPALILLLILSAVLFEQDDSRSTEHLIHVFTATWIGVLTGFVTLVLSGVDRIVDINVLQPDTSWALLGVVIALAIITGAGALTIQSYHDGTASVVDFSLLIIGAVVLIVAYFLLYFCAKRGRRPSLVTVKYGVPLLVIGATAIVMPLVFGRASYVGVFVALLVVVYVSSVAIAQYARVSNDPLPTLFSRVVYFGLFFFLQILAVLITMLEGDEITLPLLLLGLIWAFVAGILLRFVVTKARRTHIREVKAANASAGKRVETTDTAAAYGGGVHKRVSQLKDKPFDWV